MIELPIASRRTLWTLSHESLRGSGAVPALTFRAAMRGRAFCALTLLAACGRATGQLTDDASQPPAEAAQAGTPASTPAGVNGAARAGNPSLQPSAAAPGRGAAAAAGAGTSAVSGSRSGTGAAAGDWSGAAGSAAAAGRSAPIPAAGASAQIPPRPMPVERAGKYILEQGALSFEIDPMHGARITRFGLNGANLLTGPEIDALNYGSTFWPSPQQRWNWPPVPELDSQPYTVALQGDTLSCTSSPGMRAKVSVIKRVRASAVAAGIELEYTLKNEDAAPLAWAPWEITRVAAGGLSFFPSGQRVVGAQLAVVNQAGATWYRHDPKALAGTGQKLTADGSGGFLAHVAGRTLFVKQFMDVAPEQQAPAPEAEIALYAAAGYVELEPQGAYAEIMPGQSVTWRVRWLLEQVPDNVPIEVGSSALLELARSVAAR